MKITVIGSYGEGNFGDDALMICIQEILNFIAPESEIKYISNSEKYTLLDIAKDQIIRKKDLETSFPDLIIYGGGTQFFSFKSSPTQKLKKILTKLIKVVMMAVKPAKLISRIGEELSASKYHHSGIKIAAIGIGLGPFEGAQRERVRVQNLFRAIGFVAVRDAKSFQFCESLMLPRYGLYSDLCFNKRFIEKYLPPPQKNVNKIKLVGVIVRDWEHTKIGGSYAQSIIKIAETLRNDGFNVKYIIFSKYGDEKWRKRLSLMGEQIISWDPNTQKINEFLDLLNNFDYFITARYHGAVFASLLGKPAICIDIEQKLSMYSEVLMKGGALWSYPFDVDDCVNKLMDIHRNIEFVKASLSDVVRSQKNLAVRLEEDLQDYIHNTSVPLI